MYNFPRNGNFFNFREMGGLQINKVADIPYDFYSLVPTHLQPLYQEMRRERQWESGYVSGVHDRLLSSRIVPALNNILTNKIMGSGFKFDGKAEYVNLMDKWSKEIDFENLVVLGFQNSNMLGWCFVKCDRCNGEIVPAVVPADQAFYIIEKGKIVDFKSVVTYIATNDLNSTTFLMEHRYFDPYTNKPMIRHFFTKSNSQFSENASDLKNFSRGININVPLLKMFGIDAVVGENFKEKLKSYGIFIEPQELDFITGLGVEMVRATDINPTYIKYPIGQGLMAQMGEDNIIKYEIANSLASHETNIAPQIVLVPQGYDNGQLNDPFRAVGGVIGGNSSIRPINKTYYVRVPFGNADGQNAEPKAIEFNIRSNSILDMKKDALRDLVLNIGLNPNDLNLGKDKAVYVSNKESSESQDLSANTIRSKRRLMNKMFCMIVKEVLWSYGIENGDVSIKWTDFATGDFKEQISAYETAIKNFLMSPEEAIRNLYPNKTQTELDALMKEIENNRVRIQETYYGGFNQHNENLKGGSNDVEEK